eukprot:1137720-Pelagomonas_calceolata.AAC.2
MRRTFGFRTHKTQWFVNDAQALNEDGSGPTSAKYCVIWVVFPDPVSPITTSVCMRIGRAQTMNKTWSTQHNMKHEASTNHQGSLSGPCLPDHHRRLQAHRESQKT